MRSCAARKASRLPAVQLSVEGPRENAWAKFTRFRGRQSRAQTGEEFHESAKDRAGAAAAAEIPRAQKAIRNSRTAAAERISVLEAHIRATDRRRLRGHARHR